VSDSLYIASLAAQDGYGRVKGTVYTDYKALESCLQVVNATGVRPIAVPKGMGSTLGGGDWAEVERILLSFIPEALIVEKANQEVIDCFAGAHHFLSNFEPSVIQLPLDTGQQQVACQAPL